MITQSDSPRAPRAAPAPLAVAQATKQVTTTAASPEQIDLVYALRLLADSIPGLLPRVITGDIEPAAWSDLADILYRAARLCREQVVIDLAGLA
jgi:hypothetical protein